MKPNFRVLVALIVIACLPIIAGCKGPAVRNAALFEVAAKAQVQLVEAQAKQDAERARAMEVNAKALAEACAQDKSPRECLRDVAMFQAFGQMAASMERMAGAGKAADALPAVPYERDNAAKMRDVMGGMTPMVGLMANTWAGDRQGQRNADIALSHDAMLGGIVQSAIGATSSTANAAIANAQPSYTVSGGGVLVQGDQHVGDTITGDGNATNGAQLGDNITGEVVASRGSQIGDDIDVSGSDNAIDGVIDNTITDVSGAYLSGSSGNAVEQGAGDQRIGSPGPIDDHSDPGDDCSGESCNPTDGGG